MSLWLFADSSKFTFGASEELKENFKKIFFSLPGQGLAFGVWVVLVWDSKKPKRF